MPKKIPSDIVLKKTVSSQKRKSIQENLTIPSRVKRPKISLGQTTSKKRKPRLVITGIVLASIVFLFFMLSLLFSGAFVEITPKQQQVNLNGEFVAEKNTADSSKIPFAVMVIEAEESEEIVATDTKELESKASGTVIVYNDYDSRNQRLIKNTRFETSDGKIYRIDKSITVPGKKTVGGETIPGSIEAIVYADNPGEEYNIALVDFTIPGFKGDPRYSKFYARSKTEMTGGFSGIVKTISEEELNKVGEELEDKLQARLTREALAQKPEGFFLFENGNFFETNKVEQSNEGVDEDMVKISKSGKMYGVIFNESKLSQEIAKSLIARFQEGDKVKIMNLNELSFTIIDRDKFVPQEDDLFTFELQGSPFIVWEINENQLTTDLAGEYKSNFKEILSNYPNIESAEVSIRPFWRRTFPGQHKDIRIEQVVNFDDYL